MKKIIISVGEPAGIGADICLDYLNTRQSPLDTELYLVADPVLLEQRAQQLGLPCPIKIHAADSDFTNYQPAAINVIPVALRAPVTAGQLNTANSRYVLDCLDLASALTDQGLFSALVTGPVQKSIINEAGFAFTGHTEYLADKVSAKPVMMLATDSLRVALATTHLPLSEVSAAITRDSLTQTITTLHQYLKQDCALRQPAILVCGLNPHAGESGNLGREEIEVIQPVIADCQSRGINLQGPLPADTLFTPRYLERADAVLAMYHDQGLPVLKYSGFGRAVNITLGLPYLRTSVDHGTALDLAATGKADSSSLAEAVRIASNPAYQAAA